MYRGQTFKGLNLSESMKYKFGNGSSQKALHILFIPETPNEQLIFDDENNEHIDAYINDAVQKKMGSDYVATSASRLEKHQYQVAIQYVKGILVKPFSERGKF